MPTFAEHFHINKFQAQLDFVDIHLEGDLPLYIDPYVLTSRNDDWSERCHILVVSFFSTVLQAIKEKDIKAGKRLLTHLGEPEETHLGVSSNGNKGRGIGPGQAEQLFNALMNSKAAISGLLEDLPDVALFVPMIGRDKISDMTTNIIRRPLIEYTQSQCILNDVPLRKVASGFYWDSDACEWKQDFVSLPVVENKKIILVPKYSVRYQVGVDHSVYRSKFVLEFLMEEHQRADDSLVTVIRDKKGEIIRKKVFKKTVDEHYAKDKDFLAEFSAQHPKVINRYRESLKEAARRIPSIDPGVFNERDLALHLAEELRAIPSGVKDAGVYHDLIIGIVSFLYFPNLIYPVKEAKINQGRKRLDVLYTNGKDSGFFKRIASDPHIKVSLPRFFVFQQVAFKPQAVPDFAC